jgi:hypothetical protein
MRLGVRAVTSLALCAAAAGAALAHVAIDILGDYVLSRDSYDYLRHDSRPLVSGVAVLIALALAARGLRICCRIAVQNRTRLRRTVITLGEGAALIGGSLLAGAFIVPSMELLDGRLDGSSVNGLADAFGGSILLGLGTTLVCTALAALALYAIARWLLAHRDSIASLIGTLIRRVLDPPAFPQREITRLRFAAIDRRDVPGFKLSKRGPPRATSWRHDHSIVRGDFHDSLRLVSVGQAGRVPGCPMRRSRSRSRYDPRRRAGLHRLSENSAKTVTGSRNRA